MNFWDSTLDASHSIANCKAVTSHQVLTIQSTVWLGPILNINETDGCQGLFPQCSLNVAPYLNFRLCSKGYQCNGRQSKPRCLKNSLGTIVYRFAQLRDQPSGRSLIPLVEALAIPAYDHYLEDALEPGIGLSVHVS